MVRRLKSDIVDAKRQTGVPKRKLEGLEIDYSEEERQIHALLGEYTVDRSRVSKVLRFEYGTISFTCFSKSDYFPHPWLSRSRWRNIGTLLNGQAKK